MKKVIVTGGREYLNKDRVWISLDCEKPDQLITGACPTGADRLAMDWWVARKHDRKIVMKCYPADWEMYGRSAGPKRNRKMLVENPDAVVLAFPGGRGTANCVQTARDLGMTVIVVE